MNSSDRDMELLVTNQSGRSFTVRLKQGSYLLGRSRGCQIRFPPQDLGVSGKHARLIVDSREVKIEDLESGSGTMVNGKIIRSALLQSQDVISIAGYNLKANIPEHDELPADVYAQFFSSSADSSTLRRCLAG